MPVDRAKSREHLLSGRSTARSTVPSLTIDRPVDRPHPRVGHLQLVDRSVDRPKWQVSMHVLVHVGRPTLGRSTGPVDRQSLAGLVKGFKTWTF